MLLASLEIASHARLLDPILGSRVAVDANSRDTDAGRLIPGLAPRLALGLESGLHGLEETLRGHLGRRIGREEKNEQELHAGLPDGGPASTFKPCFGRSRSISLKAESQPYEIGTMARNKTETAPKLTIDEVFTGLEACNSPQHVRFLVGHAGRRAEIQQILVQEGTHLMRDLHHVDGFVAPKDSEFYFRYELHKHITHRGRYALMVDFTGWDPDQIENLFQFLAWAAWSDEWKGLKILAMGSAIPWYVQNQEQQTYGITVFV